MSNDLTPWKEKYLDSLEQIETLEASWQQRFELLRRSLTRTTMAAEGQDPYLDACLVELRAVLRQKDCERELRELTPRLEKAMLDNEEHRHARIHHVMNSLRHMAEQLRAIPSASPLRRALKHFCKQLDERVGRWSELQRLLQELEQLQQQSLASLELPPAPTFFQRLFGTQTSELSVTEEAARRPLPATPMAEELDAESNNAPPHPSEEMPCCPQSPQTCSETTTAPAFAPEPTSANAMAFLVPADFVGPMPREFAHYERNDAPPYSSVALHIESILLELLEDLHLPEQWQLQSESLQRRITKGLNWYELIPVLEDLATLLRGLPLFNHQFEDYLKQLNQRLALMQENVLRLQNGRTQQNQTTEAFETSLRQQVKSLQDSVTQATDLTKLKQVVEERLEGLLSAIDSYQRKSQENEQRLTESIHQLGERLTGMESVATELRGHLEEQQRKAQFDVLTGLPNRLAFNERLEKELKRWHHRGDSLLLAMLDIDHFKRINDTYGHLAGDRVLNILAKRWQEQLRATDFLARYGGEEFVLLMPSTRPNAGLAVLEQLRLSIESCPFHFKGERLQITVSAGLTAFAPGYCTEQVFEAADQALYRAKHAGRNRVELLLELPDSVDLPETP